MKNKLLHFALDLFSASDDEEQDSIFAQVKIYRTASVRIFEYVIGILLLAIWLLTIVNITHVAAEEWHSCLIIAVVGTVSVGLSFRHSYHPSASDLPFVKIVNARQVRCLSLCGRLQSVVYALFFIWGGCAEWIESESVFLGGMITALALMVLNCIFFTYKIYKLRHLVEVPSSPTIRNEKLLIVGTLALTIAVGFGVHCLPFWDSLPGLVSGFLKGLISLALIVGIIWAGNRFFGLFREIDKESSDSPDKQ
nr:hypothetical protein [Prevotella sp.]